MLKPRLILKQERIDTVRILGQAYRYVVFLGRPDLATGAEAKTTHELWPAVEKKCAARSAQW
jgi:hypothetical protein